MRVGAVGDEHVGVAHHLLAEIGVEVERGEDRHARPHERAHPRQDRAIGVDVSGGVGRAVQRQEDAVERHGGAQPREEVLEEPVEEALLAGAARPDGGEDRREPGPGAARVHGTHEAGDRARAARRRGVEVGGERVAREQHVGLELGARRDGRVRVGLEHEAADGDPRGGSAGGHGDAAPRRTRERWASLACTACSGLAAGTRIRDAIPGRRRPKR